MPANPHAVCEAPRADQHAVLNHQCGLEYQFQRHVASRSIVLSLSFIYNSYLPSPRNRISRSVGVPQTLVILMWSQQ